MTVNMSVLDSLGLSQAAQTSKAAPTDTNSANQNMFLKLLVAQLKNQNPLKPQDGGEFLSQLAQFSTVTGVQDLQKSFNNFADSMTSDQGIQAAGLVGKSVLLKSDKGILDGQYGLQGQINVPAGTQNVVLSIVDAKGVPVRSINVEAGSEGFTPFYWDGATDAGGVAAAGVYSLKASGLVDGKNNALETRVVTPVNSVILGGAQGLQLDLGALGQHPLSEINSII
jgi:flagellar basal-body rod modification protein FlgD